MSEILSRPDRHVWGCDCPGCYGWYSFFHNGQPPLAYTQWCESMKLELIMYPTREQWIKQVGNQ